MGRGKERVTVLMSRMVARGGSSMNKDYDELWLKSFDLSASRKKGCFLRLDCHLQIRDGLNMDFGIGTLGLRPPRIGKSDAVLTFRNAENTLPPNAGRL
jgi:hypothetical protein